MKIRIIMDEGIGNMVNVTPAIRAIKEVCPDTSITVLGKPIPLEVIAGWELVDMCVNVPGEEHYDITFMSIWSSTFGREYGEEIKATSDKIIGIKYDNLDMHEAEHQLKMARYLGYKGSLPETFCMTDDNLNLPIDPNTPIVALSDTCLNLKEWQRKRWPYYKLLAAELIEQGYQVILVGGVDEDVQYNAPDWPEEVVNCMGRYSIRQTAALIRACDHFIGNDSGPAHISAAVGTDTTVIFGPTRTAKNRPLGDKVKVIQRNLACSPCQYTSRWSKCDDNACMGMVSVQDVLSVMRGGYNYPEYWKKRLDKFGSDLRGVGHAGKSKEQNEAEYEVAIRTLSSILKAEKVDVKTARILDIGCGAGVYTQAFKDMGAEHYAGIDITDALFSTLQHRFPEYTFNHIDITTQEMDGEYDLILMLDVTQHITNEDAFLVAMENVRWRLSDDGLLLVTTWNSDSIKWNSYYEKMRPIDSYRNAFDGYVVKNPVRFRDKSLLRIHHPDRAKEEAAISACMIIKDEEEFLPACLDSIKDLVSEIVVVIDTRTTDRSAEIAEEYGARIYYRDWDDFSGQRTFSFGLATGDWILYIDGDERLETEDHDLIRKIIAQCEDRPEIEAIMVDIISHVKGRTSKHECERIFRTGSTHFEGIKHNQPKYEGKKAASPVRIYHYGYDLSSEKMQEKNAESLRLSLQALKADPYNAMLHQHVSRAWRAAGRWDQVLECHENYYRCIQAAQTDLYAQTDQMIGIDAIFARMMKGEYLLARALAIDMTDRYPNNLDAHFLLGDIYSKLEEYDESIEAFEMYLVIMATMRHQAQRDNLIKDTWGLESETYNSLGVAYRYKGDVDEALVCFRSAGHYDPHDERIQNNYEMLIEEILDAHRVLEVAV